MRRSAAVKRKTAHMPIRAPTKPPTSGPAKCPAIAADRYHERNNHHHAETGPNQHGFPAVAVAEAPPGCMNQVVQ